MISNESNNKGNFNQFNKKDKKDNDLDPETFEYMYSKL